MSKLSQDVLPGLANRWDQRLRWLNGNSLVVWSLQGNQLLGKIEKTPFWGVGKGKAPLQTRGEQARKPSPLARQGQGSLSPLYTDTKETAISVGYFGWGGEGRGKEGWKDYEVLLDGFLDSPRSHGAQFGKHWVNNVHSSHHQKKKKVWRHLWENSCPLPLLCWYNVHLQGSK